MNYFWSGLLTLCRDFTGWTSAHGIPQVGSARNWLVRIIWATMWLCAFAMFVYQMSEVMIAYFEWSVNVSTELDSYTAWVKSSAVSNTGPLAGAGNARDALFQDTDDPLQWQRIMEAAAALLGAQLDATTMKDMTMSIDKEGGNNVLVQCTYDGDDCSDVGNWVEQFNPMFGRCYTFNNDASKRAMRAGPDFGLKLMLKLNQEEFMPQTDAAAYRVTIHVPGWVGGFILMGYGQDPFPDAFGFLAGAGYTNSFSVKYTTVIRLPHPYSTCTPDGIVPTYFYPGEYSMEACFRSCWQEQIKAQCQCVDPRYAAAEVPCILKAEREDENFNVNKDCECPQNCKLDIFTLLHSDVEGRSQYYTRWTAKLGGEEPSAQLCELAYYGGHPSTLQSQSLSLS